MARTKPNILISGTPGTGKTTTSQMLAEKTGLRHIEVGKWCAEHHFYTSFDEEYQCNVLDEDALLDSLEDIMSAGGVIIDYHGVDFFPERWFDLVVILRTDNSELYPRLEARGYSGKKLDDNMECEIMQVILEEARDSYDENIIWELQSDSVEQMDANVERMATYCQTFTGKN
eukprot:c3573_g1_i1.p1 GENE.c3573_g1_i1~~c3573_g1_i1.p1  ORF type:complete len:173 (+),score=39.62 c3573_g1_i1:60-578(+)